MEAPDQARQRLATLGAASAGGTPMPVGFLEVRTGGQHEGTWVSVVVRRLDPAYLEHAPAREGQVLRGLEVALLARIQVLTGTSKG